MNEKEDKLKELFEVQHSQWINNPTTQSFLKALEKHKNTFVDILSANVEGQMTDQQFRRISVNIKNTDAILSLARNSEIFYKQLNPNKEN
jgi:hypothetical protein